MGGERVVTCVSGLGILISSLALADGAAPVGTASEGPADAPHAIVTRWDTVWKVEPLRTQSTLVVTKEILIQDPLGFDHANQMVLYRSRQSEIKAFHARTIQPDGTTVELTSAMRHDRPLVRSSEQDWRSMQFTFPDVRPGSLLSYRLELHTSDDPFFMPIDSGYWELQSELPVQSARLTVLVKEDRKHHKAWSTPLVSLDSWCRREDQRDFDMVGFTLSCEQVPAFVPEPFAPPDADLRARALVFDSPTPFGEGDWGWLGEAFGRGFGEFLAASDTVEEIASAWRDPNLRPTQQIETVITWVRENVALGSEPSRRLDEVIKRRSGTAVERNMLAIALMRALRLAVRPALLVDRTLQRFDRTIPNLHLLEGLFIALGNRENPKYLDVNCEFCVPGVPPWRYLGPGSGGIVFDLIERPTDPARMVPPWRQLWPSGMVVYAKTELLPAKFNARVAKRTITLAESGDATVEGELRWQLQQDVDRRELWNELTEAGRIEDCLSAAGHDGYEAQVEVSDPMNFAENINCRFRFDAPGRAQRVGTQLVVAPDRDLVGILELPEQEQRRHPLRWRYPQAAQSETVFRLPDGALLPELPQPVTVNGPKALFQARWAAAAEPGSIVFKAQLLLEAAELPASDYDALRAFRTAVLSALHDGIAIEVGR
jgi:hypothetical protein